MKTLLFAGLFMIFLSAAGQNPNENDFTPVQLPEWTAPISYSSHDHYLKGYDVISKTEFIADSTKYPDFDESRSTEPFITENLGINEETPWNRNLTDLELIENTSNYPASGNVKLFIKFPGSNSTYIGSGILISKNVVLTAGHCIYDKDLGGWADWIKVVPGYKNGTEPFGHSFATCMYSWLAWTDNENFDWDMGAIALDWCIGLECGYFGKGTYNDEFFTSNTFHNYSYPGASPYNGSSMYYRYGNFDQVLPDILYFNNKSYGGQSGSGLYYKDVNGNRCAYAVLSHSNSSTTGCTRITSPKFDYLCEIINKNQACSYTGVDEITKENKLCFDLYPNPVKDKINIQLDEEHGLCTISVYNVLGKIVMTKSIERNEHSVTLSASNLMNGCYIVSISDGKSISSKTFIKASN